MTSTTPRGGPDRREQRRIATRERLLTVALELFATQGYAGTTYDHIAARADVGRQTAFNHFRRKEDFVAAWIERRHALMDQRAAADTAAGRPAAQALADVLRELSDLMAEEYTLAKGLFDGGVLQAVFGSGTGTPRAILATVERGQAAGEIRRDADAEAVADLIADAYVTAVGRWLAAGGDHSLTDTLLARLDVLAAGFAA
ncbi:TetR/AcrR family transcriptional regulator [Streptomyces sp. NPDC048717]|uniref:TetR/AcrR family transcriptional regulator n=1 Tax=Streptomyces sp. NPDC048717 TaxID=3154928 RepID=UPI00341F1655